MLFFKAPLESNSVNWYRNRPSQTLAVIKGELSTDQHIWLEKRGELMSKASKKNQELVEDVKSRLETFTVSILTVIASEKIKCRNSDWNSEWGVHQTALVWTVRCNRFLRFLCSVLRSKATGYLCLENYHPTARPAKKIQSSTSVFSPHGKNQSLPYRNIGTINGRRKNGMHKS